MYCDKGIRFNWFFLKFWAGSIFAGTIIFGMLIDKIGIEIPGTISTIIYFLLYILPAILGIPLFLKGK